MRITGKILFAAALALVISCTGTVDPEDQLGNGSTDGSGGNEPGMELSSGYLQQMVAMQFTSVGCVNCPTLAASVKNIMKNMPGTIIPVAFHLDYEISDPMTLSINKRFYDKVDVIRDGSPGLPMFALNFRQSSRHIVSEYAKIQSEIEYQAQKYPAQCGVAIETSFDEKSRTVSVSAHFKSDVAASYRYHIFLLEDGIGYMQAGDETGTYVQDNVLRSMSGDDVRGSRLSSGNALEAGKEYVVKKDLALSAGWNAADMKVMVALLREDSAAEWGAYNANVCAVGASVDYLYVEKDE